MNYHEAPLDLAVRYMGCTSGDLIGHWICALVAGGLFIGPLLLRPAFFITDWCMIFRDDRRCLHDLIAGTRVVKA